MVRVLGSLRPSDVEAWETCPKELFCVGGLGQNNGFWTRPPWGYSGHVVICALELH